MAATGSRDGAPLITAAGALLAAFLAHNESEQRVLRPLLLEADAFGEVRIDSMVASHVEEHKAMAAALEALTKIANPTQAAAALQSAATNIRGHMEVEEKHFLNDKVLRDDLVAIDASDG